MSAGRPKIVDPAELYDCAQRFYSDFRRLETGTVRSKFDKSKYETLTEHLDEERLIDDEDRARHEVMVEEEIRKGQLDASKREERLSYIADSERWARLEDRRQDAERQARKEIKVPGQLDVIEALLNPKATPEQVRVLCKDATMSRKNVEVEVGVFRDVEVLAWPIPSVSPFPTYLAQYAEQYISALNHPRFPRCDVSKRPTNRLKQFWFLSRALAGAVCGVKTRTAINLVGSLRPEEMFREARDGKPARRRRKVRRK